jgi:Phytanoyl-CoA dioxygenase (PhyH)
MLTQLDIDAYHRDGFLSGIRVMTDAEVQHYRDEFDALEAKEGREKAYNGIFDRHFDQRFIWDIATHPKILDCVGAILGPDVLMLSTHCFCKYGPEEKFVAWHQDLRYWGLEPPVEVSAWYAVDDSDRGNGCMRVIPRLHRDGLVEHGKSSQPGNLLSINQEVSVCAEEEQAAVDCVLQAGEISLHDGMLLHGSLPNRSTRRRCGVAVRYLPAHVKPIEAGPIGTNWKWRPILLRGTDDGCGFDVERPPFPLT